MKDFGDAEMDALLKRKKLCNEIGYVLFAILAVSAVIAATLAKGAYENYLGQEWNLYLAALICAVTFLLVFISHIIFFVRRAGAALELAICKRVAAEFYNNAELLQGGRTVALSVTYEGDILTVSRADGALRPVEVSGGGIVKDKNAVRFDISALRKVPAVYGAFGTRIWKFVAAYYAVNGGVDSVTLTDNMGKKPVALTIVADGKTNANAQKNYFIKTGLVK